MSDCELSWHRTKLPDHALTRAVAGGHSDILQVILGADFGVMQPEDTIKHTITTPNIEGGRKKAAISGLLKDMMRDKKPHRAFFGRLHKCKADDTQVTCALQKQRAGALRELLTVCETERALGIQSMCLPLWLQCVAGYYWSSRIIDFDDKAALTAERFLVLSGAECVNFLSEELPPALRSTILRRLGLSVVNHEARDICLSTRDGGNFCVHRDILCYWSSRFTRVSADASIEHIPLEGSISSRSLEMMVNYMYSGRYTCYKCVPRGV
ncbi:hypothetical protein BJY04DRAFT_222109 [Aspergillus karnatakaensis]|uniref:BTB/POZ domain-containing protein n=1 Tax=Aspergillus karnatakaensis TaxID=1810916 RepID=UPI003CCE1375